MSFELYIPEERPQTNSHTGRFLPGHTPHNKGKKWDDFAGKRAQKRMAKGWKNLVNGRKFQKGMEAYNRRKVVAVTEEKFLVFPSTKHAAEWVGGPRENISRCCRMNKERHVNKYSGKVNTDHKYKGIRFYFENDDIWIDKIKQKAR